MESVNPAVDDDVDARHPVPPVSFTGRRTLVPAGIAVVLIAAALFVRPVADRDDARPPDPSARAAAAVGAGSPAAAVDLAALIADRETWLRAHPDDDGSWAVLGSAHLEQHRRTADTAWLPKAEAAFARSLALRPTAKGNVQATVGTAALAVARGDFAAGRKWAEQAREKAPKEWSAHAVLVDAYAGMGEHKKAEAAAEKLRELGPALTANIVSARLYRDRGWREDATTALVAAAGAAGSPAEKAYALRLAGDLHEEKGELPQALGSYDAALKADPSQVRVLAGRARALAASGRTADAERDYRTALHHAPDPRVALEFGEFLDSLDRGAEAGAPDGPYAELRKAAARSAGHGVDEEVVLGLYEADHGEPEAAVARLRGEWGRHPNETVADALGWALHRAGMDTEALDYAKKATELGRRSSEFAYHRALIERELGDVAAARRHLQDALRTHPTFSPVRAPIAREALETIGQPPAGGPRNVLPTRPWVPPVMPKPKPKPGKPGPAATELPTEPAAPDPAPAAPAAPEPGGDPAPEPRAPQPADPPGPGTRARPAPAAKPAPEKPAAKPAEPEPERAPRPARTAAAPAHPHP
ncbi:tetratricopeptide repeat protein [Streptomyces sp. BI20]|uniref:tetratricopeptide repeat protein n=1 Tax=Streptomyces sp. BI20 TaxID=3403460 RepID=UPI003C77EF6E